jgi:hypothetical protein
MECRSATVWAVPACEPSYQQNACEAGEICVDGACREPLPGDQCDLAFEIAAESAVHRGQTGGGIQNTYEGDCGGEGPEVVYTFTLEAPARFSAGATGFDTLLYLRRDCDPEQEIACNDDRDDDNRSALIQAELDAGTYHLFVDGYRRAGEYELTVDFQPPCEVECEPGTQRCTEAGLSTCEAGPDGCPQWGEAAPCGDAERCVEDACVSIPEGDSCADAIRLPAEPVVIEGNLSAHTSTYAGTCGGIGPDRTYRFDLEQTTRLLARLEGDQPVFTLHQECPIVESRICSFNQNPLEFNVLLRPGTHYLIVDSRSADAGAFTLTFDFVVECPDCEDGGMPDAGVEDAGLPDSQVVDAAPADMGLPDVQVPVDAARPDMPQLDARPVDAASEDARVMPDATADSGPPPNAIVSSDGCHATPAGGSSWALLGMLLWAARRRRSMS